MCSLIMIVRICVLYHIIIIIIIIINPEIWIIRHFSGLGHETMICAECLAMFLGNRRRDGFLIHGRFNLHCPASSCSGRCNMSADGKSHCSCDEYCRFLGDCCVDSHIHCFGAQAEETHMLLPIEDNSTHSNALKASMTCNELSYKGETHGNGWSTILLKKFIMVSSCPTGSAGAGKCIYADTDVMHYTPVCLRQHYLIFRNIFCLRCHGYSEEDAVAFKLSLPMCSTLPVEFYITEFSDNITLANNLWKDCGYWALNSIPENCEATANRMQCHHINPSVANPNCSGYSNPVVIDNSVYKNQFCVPEIHTRPRCFEYDGFPHYVDDIPLSLMILFNFSNGFPAVKIKLTENEYPSYPVVSNDVSNDVDFVQFLAIALFLSHFFWR